MAKKLTRAVIRAAALEHGIEEPALRAVIAVESGGSGFLPDGRLKILFEGHHLWKRLRQRGINPAPLAAAHPTLCFPSWTRAHYRGGIREWQRVQTVREWAAKRDPARVESYRKAALESCSWGLFQLMGFNHLSAGFPNVDVMVGVFETGEEAQLHAILRWLDNRGLMDELRRKDWNAFARGYNGSGQVPYYSGKLRAAYARASR